MILINEAGTGCILGRPVVVADKNGEIEYINI